MIKMPLSFQTSALLCFAAVASCTAIPPENSQANTPSTSSQSSASIDAAHADVLPEVSAEAATVFDVVKQETVAENIRRDFEFSGDPKQGGLIVARAPSGASDITLNGQSLPITPDGYFLMGFNRDADAIAKLRWAIGAEYFESDLSVAKGKWRLEHINASYRGGARSSAEFKRRRSAELAQIKDARSENNKSDGWRQDFIWPVKGRLSGLFGAQRVYQGKPGPYHGGMDVAVPTGTPFVAPADGVVTLATKNPFTLEGYLLMVDHGMGLNSAFLHCSKILVEKGQRIKQGQVIGHVGKTGRATGPHLHWGMKWNAARVDPLLLVP